MKRINTGLTTNGISGTDDRVLSAYKWILSKSPESAMMICCMYDHKGDMTVTWLEDPMPWQKQLANDAWELQNEPNCSHEVIEVVDFIVHDVTK